MKDEIKKAEDFCNKKWDSMFGETKLLHRCYLDIGHKGDCVCGECDEFPIELHSYEGEEKNEAKSAGE